MTEKKKILLIYPPSPIMNREDRCQQPVKDLLVIPPLPPTDLMYLAAVAENINMAKPYEEHEKTELPQAKIEISSEESSAEMDKEIKVFIESEKNEEKQSVAVKIEEEKALKVSKSQKTKKRFDSFEPKSIYYEAKIVDYSLMTDKSEISPVEQFKKDLKDFEPNYLLINVASTTLENDLSILDVAKAICPNIITIAKGAHFLTSNTDVLYNHKALDLVIVGEAEETLKEILEEKPYQFIRGLCYRDGYVAKYTGKRQFIKDLDQLPFPARHLVDNNIYTRPDNGKVQAIIKVARGCPFHCFFCLATPVSGAKVRMRSPENIVAEIKECVNKYGITNFVFWSDLFNFDRDWVIDLCDEIIESGLDITWSSNMRADGVDEELAEIMYEAGCRLVSMGVESGSQYILDKIGKKILLEEIRQAVKTLKEAKIKVYSYFVLGLPWDNEDTIEETIMFSIWLNSDFTSFYTATPLPGTRFHKFAMENHLLNKDISWESAYYSPVIATMCLSKERVFELHKQAIKRFYLRTEYITQALLRIRSFKEFKNYVKMGTKILFRK